MKSKVSDLIKRGFKLFSRLFTGVRVGIFRGESLVKAVNVLGLIFLLLYIYGMFLYPSLSTLSWSHVHSVWMEWQTLNVGVLAFISSLIAFNISKYHVRQQRQREFIAAKSFLPEALSELVGYFRKSANCFTEAWYKALSNTNKLRMEPPTLPSLYRETFSRNIAHAEPEVAAYLAYILVRLQVHHSRITNLREDWESLIRSELDQKNIVSYMYCLGELQCLIARLFDFARGVEEFIDEPLTWTEFENAYFNLNIDLHSIEDLEGFTKRALERGKGQGWKK